MSKQATAGRRAQPGQGVDAGDAARLVQRGEFDQGGDLVADGAVDADRFPEVGAAMHDPVTDRVDGGMRAIRQGASAPRPPGSGSAVGRGGESGGSPRGRAGRVWGRSPRRRRRAASRPRLVLRKRGAELQKRGRAAVQRQHGSLGAGFAHDPLAAPAPQPRTSGRSSPCSRIVVVVAGRLSTICWRSQRGPDGQPRDPVDHVHDQVEAVEVVAHDHVEGRRGGAFLLVAAHVEVVVVVRR